MKKMGKRAIFFGLLALFFGVVTVSTENTQTVSENIIAKPLGVDEFMTSVERHPGDVCVRGIVSFVSAERKMIGLIDTQEYKSCKVVTCARLTLPVLWEGQMPKVKETVTIEGRVEKRDKKMIFVAALMKSDSSLEETK